MSILFERAGFEDSYRRITDDILSFRIFCVAHVSLQLRFDNGDGLSGISSWEEQGQVCDDFGVNMKIPISPSSSTSESSNLDDVIQLVPPQSIVGRSNNFILLAHLNLPLEKALG